jgi:HSP20 family protein
MANVKIETRPEGREPAVSLMEETRELFDRLQKRAFSLFQQRGSQLGRELDDWFEAERELFNIPPSDLVETDGGFHLTAGVPGLEAKDLEITVTPRELLIRGKSEAEKKREEGKAHIEERCHNEIFRRYALPAAVEVEKVTANVEKGLLTMEMPKAAVRQIPVSAKTAKTAKTARTAA